MALVEIIMPKLGESIKEATVLNWIKKVGESVDMDEPILEVATDKVDSEIASTSNGVLTKILFEENDVVKVGEVLAIIDSEGESIEVAKEDKETESTIEKSTEKPKAEKQDEVLLRTDASGRFYSPLVRNMAKAEGISAEELNNIHGSGAKGRVIKKDVLEYLSSGRKTTNSQHSSITPMKDSFNGETEIIEMDRMRSMIAVSYTHLTLPTTPYV